MSSKRRVRRRSCTIKVAFVSEAAARAGIGRLVGVRVYKCEFGNHWHVGHPSYRISQGIRAKRERGE